MSAPRNTRGPRKSLYLGALTPKDFEESDTGETKLVYGDNVAERSDDLFWIMEELHRNSDESKLLPSELSPEAFLRPIREALKSRDSDFFNLIACLCDQHRDGFEPCDALHIALLTLKRRDNLTQGTIREITEALESLRNEDGYKQIIIPERHTIKSACERVGIVVVKSKR